jgi:hypothetical protein
MGGVGSGSKTDLRLGGVGSGSKTDLRLGGVGSGTVLRLNIFLNRKSIYSHLHNDLLHRNERFKLAEDVLVYGI